MLVTKVFLLQNLILSILERFCCVGLDNISWPFLSQYVLWSVAIPMTSGTEQYRLKTSAAQEFWIFCSRLCWIIISGLKTLPQQPNLYSTSDSQRCFLMLKGTVLLIFCTAESSVTGLWQLSNMIVPVQLLLKVETKNFCWISSC